MRRCDILEIIGVYTVVSSSRSTSIVCEHSLANGELGEVIPKMIAPDSLASFTFSISSRERPVCEIATTTDSLLNVLADIHCIWESEYELHGMPNLKNL